MSLRVVVVDADTLYFVRRQLTEKRPDIPREVSKIAIDKSPPESFTFPDVRARARGDVAPYTYHNCKMCLLGDMQEMISTVKLDDRATAACGSKNGRYELPRLSTSVKDNLWSNKSVTGSPAIPSPRPLSPPPRHKDLGAFFIESTRRFLPRSHPRRAISDAANRAARCLDSRAGVRLLFFFRRWHVAPARKQNRYRPSTRQIHDVSRNETRAHARARALPYVRQHAPVVRSRIRA